MTIAVITAGGKGTRLLPTTKELPKEMMPIFRKIKKDEQIVVPLLQFIFEQLYSIGIKDFCFVTGREKRSIEDHFSPHESFLKELSGNYNELISNFYKKIEDSDLVWINQNKPQGFGDAVKQAEKYIGKNDFIVHAGDTAIIGKGKHPISRLIKTAENDPEVSAVLLCKKVKNPKRYGVPKIKKIKNGVFKVLEVEEKPEKPKSSLMILPLYYFKADIFDALKKIKRGKNNEYQLTDGIQKLISDGKKVIAITINEAEYELDVGTVESYKKSLDISYKKA